MKKIVRKNANIYKNDKITPLLKLIKKVQKEKAIGPINKKYVLQNTPPKTEIKKIKVDEKILNGNISTTKKPKVKKSNPRESGLAWGITKYREFT